MPAFETTAKHKERMTYLTDAMKRLCKASESAIKYNLRTIQVTYSDHVSIRNAFDMFKDNGVGFVHINFIDIPEDHNELYEFWQFQKNENFELLKKEDPGFFFHNIIFKKDITLESGDFELRLSIISETDDETGDYLSDIDRIDIRLPDFYKESMPFKVTLPDTEHIKKLLGFEN